MKYITLNDLNNTIRKNICKIDHDIDCVIAVPRSGMIPGSIISEFLNVPLIDINSFCEGLTPTGGNRLKLVQREDRERKKLLVIDDTCYSGGSMKEAKERLSVFKDKYDFIYCAVYAEGKGINELDVYMEDVRKYTDNLDIVLYEWNIFHHYPFISGRTMYDLDGVMCVDPCDERMKAVYEDYIRNAVPLFVPTVKIYKIVTFRLIKYADITVNWLRRHNIRYDNLIMFNAENYEDRAKSGITPEQMKGNAYKNDANAILFVESDDFQAQKIHEISGKPVLCVGTNILYGGE